MTGPGLTDYLDHIAEAAGLIADFTRGMSKEQFGTDKRTLHAVLNDLSIIGEASTKLLQKYPDFVARHPETPWRRMKGMRDCLAHGYFAVNVELVWAVVSDYLPELRAQLPALRTDAEALERSPGSKA